VSDVLEVWVCSSCDAKGLEEPETGLCETCARRGLRCGVVRKLYVPMTTATIVAPTGQARRSDPRTAQDAAAIPRFGTKRRMVLDAVIAAGEHGLTAEEATRATGVEFRTLTPRIGELKRDGWVQAATFTRPGTHGVDQQVIMATEKARVARDA
jgi:hypothetical protein